MTLSFLSGVSDLEQAVSRLPPLDLSLLISTARYLLCLDIADTLEELQMKMKTAEESLSKKIENWEFGKGTDCGQANRRDGKISSGVKNFLPFSSWEYDRW
jgi:hypothetical protein